MTTANMTAIAHCILLEIRELMESRPLESISEFKIHNDELYELVDEIPNGLFSEERYFALKYSTVSPIMPLGIVRCNTDEEKLYFLQVLRDRLKEGKEINWDEVEKAVENLPEIAMANVMTGFSDGETEEFPWEGNLPYWMTEQWKNQGYELENVQMTIGFCPRHCAEVKYLCKPKDDNWLLMKTEAYDGEEETNLDDELKALDELERILVRQTFVTSSNKSFAGDTDNVYGSFPYAVYIGHWCIPSPENLALLQDWSKDEYWQELGREKYYVSDRNIKEQYSQEDWTKNVFKEAAIAWMKAVSIQLRKREEYSYSGWKKEWRKAIKVIRAI